MVFERHVSSECKPVRRAFCGTFHGLFVLLFGWLVAGCTEPAPTQDRCPDVILDSQTGSDLGLDWAWSEPDAVDEGTDRPEEEGDQVSDPSIDGSGDQGPQEVSDDAISSPTLSAMDLSLLTEGGFTGQGATDITLEEGVMAIHQPYGDPSDCTATLTASQLETLLEAARQVDWDAVEPSYRRPENPHCCCDQIAYTFTVDLTWNGGAIETVETEWCSETLISGEMPRDLLGFLTTLGEMGALVLANCQQTSRSYTDIALDLETDGGYTGLGGRDYHLGEGSMTVFNPFLDPDTCTAILSRSQMDLLLLTAGEVDWQDLESSYIPEDNPFCCCDQIVSALGIVLTTSSSQDEAYETAWCSESVMSGEMPTPFLTFLAVLDVVGDEVTASCNQE